MLVKYFAWIKNITEIEEEVIEDPSIIDVNSLKLVEKNSAYKSAGSSDSESEESSNSKSEEVNG